MTCWVALVSTDHSAAQHLKIRPYTSGASAHPTSAPTIVLILYACPCQMEDRPVVKERVTYLREHRPVEKAYVVSV